MMAISISKAFNSTAILDRDFSPLYSLRRRSRSAWDGKGLYCAASSELNYGIYINYIYIC
jgi:hypothetical protein